MEIVVTGGAGFIGSHICEELLKRGEEVVCVDNFFSGDLRNIKPMLDNKNFKLKKVDIRGKETLREACIGADAVIHLAAQVHVDRSYIDPEKTYSINVGGTQNILEIARESRSIKKVLFASSSEVYGSAQYVPIDENHPLDAPHPYGASKIAGDRMCNAYKKTYGMDVAIIRSFNVFGPRQKDVGYGGVISIFTRRLMNGMPPMVYGSGEQKRDYTFISDTVGGYMEILYKQEKGIGPINLGTGKEVSILEVAKGIASLLGRDIGPIFENARINEVSRLICNANKAKKEIGWAPKIEFEEGLRRYIEWYRVYGMESALVI